jgi:hypothetical protein
MVQEVLRIVPNAVIVSEDRFMRIDDPMLDAHPVTPKEWMKTFSNSERMDGENPGRMDSALRIDARPLNKRLVRCQIAEERRRTTRALKAVIETKPVDPNRALSSIQLETIIESPMALAKRSFGMLRSAQAVQHSTRAYTRSTIRGHFFVVHNKYVRVSHGSSYIRVGRCV